MSRFRKGKKAFKSALRSPKQAKLCARYLAYIEYKRAQTIIAFRLAQCAAYSAVRIAQVSAIQATSLSSPEKASSIAKIVIETAREVQKTLSTPII